MVTTPSQISFKRGDLNLAGLLYKPADFSAEKKYHAVIVQGSATSIKEQMSDTYCRKLAQKGFIALGFDYSHYGASDGEPRQYENYKEKVADLKAAIDYLLSLPSVKDVAMIGVCTSGGTMPYLAAEDQRLKAAASVAGFFVDPQFMKAMFGDEIYNQRLQMSDQAKEKYHNTREQSPVIAYSETDPTAANYMPVVGAFDYYLNASRGCLPQYKNELDVMSYRPMLAEFNSFEKASRIKCPVILVHSDGCSFPEQAKKFYAMLNCEKELAWNGGGTHFDYYDQPLQVDYAVKRIAEFFRNHLD